MNKDIISLEKAAKWFEEQFPQHDFAWRKGSKRYVGLCPFHPDTHPSFNIFIGEDGNIFYKCFACGRTGTFKAGTSEFVQKSTELSKIVNLMHNLLLEDSEALAILNEKIAEDGNIQKTKEVAERYQIGVIHPERLNSLSGKIVEEIRRRVRSLNSGQIPLFLFPYYNMAGYVVGVKIRNLCESSRSSRMYQLVRTESFFGLNYFLKTTKNNRGFVYPVFVTEGESDALSINFFTDLPAVAAGSVSNFKNVLKAEFSLYNHFPILFPDNDPMSMETPGAGKEAIIRLEEERKKKRKEKIYVYVGDYYGVKDINEFFKKSYDFSTIEEKDIRELSAAKVVFEKQWKQFKLKKYKEIANKVEKILPAISEAYKDFLEIKDTVEAETFTTEELLSANFEEGYALLGRFPEGHISVLSSYGGTGKTIFALITAIRIATREYRKVFFWTTEHRPASLRNKIRYIMELPEFSDKHDYGVKLPNEEFLKNITFKFGKPETFLTEKKTLNEKAFSIFEEILQKHEVVILDPVLSFIGATENDNPEVRKVFDMLHDMLQSYQGRTLILLHHFNKASLSSAVIKKDKVQEINLFRIKVTDLEILDSLKASVRGAGAYVDSARYVEALAKTEDGQRIAITIKTNEEYTRREGEGEKIPELMFKRETKEFEF